VSDDIAAAARWLYGRDPDFGPVRPVWPPHKPYVVVWCPHPRKPCRIGAVYATPYGFLFTGLNRQHRKDRAAGSRGGSRSLLTYPDGTLRDYGFVGRLYCRHGERGFSTGRPLHEIAAGVAAGRDRRPANIVMH
jgi:hypothetical protein